ncbi:MAG: hypothetical protein KC912_18575 [Proteobacteria bacterium]|nr:hypothetical protein [Pseudomonadota bacterium]
MASASPCETPLGATDVAEVVEAADAALRDDDLIAFGEVFKGLRERTKCLDVAVSPDPWARFLVYQAIVELALGREWRPSMLTALHISPNVPHDFGPADIRGFVTSVPDKTHWVPVATDATFYLDGIRVDAVPPAELAGPHIAQSFADGRWDSRYLEDEPYPSNWLAPPEIDAPSKKASPVVPIVGTSLAVIGAGLGIGTYAASRSVEYPSEGTETALKATNVGGWSLAGVGGVLAGTSLVLRLNARPRTPGLSLGGRL